VPESDWEPWLSTGLASGMHDQAGIQGPSGRVLSATNGTIGMEDGQAAASGDVDTRRFPGMAPELAD